MFQTSIGGYHHRTRKIGPLPDPVKPVTEYLRGAGLLQQHHGRDHLAVGHQRIGLHQHRRLRAPPQHGGGAGDHGARIHRAVLVVARIDIEIAVSIDRDSGARQLILNGEELDEGAIDRVIGSLSPVTTETSGSTAAWSRRSSGPRTPSSRSWRRRTPRRSSGRFAK